MHWGYFGFQILFYIRLDFVEGNSKKQRDFRNPMHAPIKKGFTLTLIPWNDHNYSDVHIACYKIPTFWRNK